MRATTVSNVPSQILAWGNGLGLRITKPIAAAAHAQVNSSVVITAQPGRIIIDIAPVRPTLEAMLATYDPKKHGGEVMEFAPLGLEVL